MVDQEKDLLVPHGYGHLLDMNFFGQFEKGMPVLGLDVKIADNNKQFTQGNVKLYINSHNEIEIESDGQYKLIYKDDPCTLWDWSLQMDFDCPVEVDKKFTIYGSWLTIRK